MYGESVSSAQLKIMQSGPDPLNQSSGEAILKNSKWQSTHWTILFLSFILTWLIAGCGGGGASSPSGSPAGNSLTIMTAGIPSGTSNNSFSTVLTASGGTPPYTWSMVSGTLPAGLSLSGTGTIAGTPTATGSFSFTVQVK